MSAPRIRKGRPRKVRPQLGDPLRPGMSLRDIAAATGANRKFLARALAYAEIDAATFDRIVESDQVDQIKILARRRTGKAIDYVRRCPHCYMPLKIEDAR